MPPSTPRSSIREQIAAKRAEVRQATPARPQPARKVDASRVVDARDGSGDGKIEERTVSGQISKAAKSGRMLQICSSSSAEVNRQAGHRQSRPSPSTSATLHRATGYSTFRPDQSCLTTKASQDRCERHDSVFLLQSKTGRRSK